MNREMKLVLGLALFLIVAMAGIVLSVSGQDDDEAQVDGSRFSLEEDEVTTKDTARRRGRSVSTKESEESDDAEEVEAQEALVEIPPGLAGLFGFVRTRDGKPVADAVVAIHRDTSAVMGASRLGDRVISATTDAEGAYAFAELEPEDWLLLAVEHADFAAKVIPGLALAPDQRRTLDVTLLVGAEIKGRVLDDAGVPIPGATVAVANQNGRVGPNGIPEEARCMTDADGRFRMAHLTLGFKRVWARKEGYATAQQHQVFLKRGTAPAPLKIELGPGLSIRGFVRDAEGLGIAQALVTATRMRDAAETMPSQPLPPVQTDENGAFVYDGVRAGNYTVGARKRGFAVRGGFQHVRAGSTKAKIVLRRNPMIKGRVVDAETGEAVERFYLVASSTRQLVIDSGGARQHFHDANGQFAFDGKRTTGKIWLIAQSRGYAGGHVGPIDLQSLDRLGEVIIKVDKGVLVRGRIEDDAGDAVAGATVMLQAWPRGAKMARNGAGAFVAKMRRVRFRALTDESGEYALRAVLPGHYRLRVEAKGYATDESSGSFEVLSGTENVLEVRQIQRPARLSGVARSNTASGRRPLEIVLRGLEGAMAPVYRIRVDANGAFSHEGIRPGTYIVEMGSALLSAGSEMARVTLNPGEDRQLDL